jgi:UDP-N-acetylmuramoylalanine--D-glutamate ligase
MVQKVAILGYADQGKSAVAYWDRPEYEITVCDSRADIDIPEQYATQLGDTYLEKLDRFDVIVRGAPTIHPKDIVAANGPEILQKITSNTNEFLRVCPTKNVIGITGTKGKGTTSTLVARMLEAAGKCVHLGGNIGTPPLDMLQNGIKPEDWVVLELANFQLIDIAYSPHIAVCLIVVPEHLNWHADMDEYTSAKSRLFEYQNSNDIALYFAGSEASWGIARAGTGQKVPYFESPGAWINGNMVTIDGQELCTTDEIKLLGAHNWQNVCAAITAVWQAGVHDIEAIRSAVKSFSGLEHRLEFVRELDGIRYYDDSFGTTPETAIVALAAFDNPKVVVLGGSDKGASYNELAKAVANSNVRKAVLIGEQAEIIKEALSQAGFTNIIENCQNMIEIVDAARATAQTGDVVLLSTGCASFGMFDNYKDRGEQFKQAVLSLA